MDLVMLHPQHKAFVIPLMNAPIRVASIQELALMDLESVVSVRVFFYFHNF